MVPELGVHSDAGNYIVYFTYTRLKWLPACSCRQWQWCTDVRPKSPRLHGQRRH